MSIFDRSKEAKPMSQSEPLEKFIPKKHLPADTDGYMTRATEAYQALQNQCADLRTRLETAQTEIGSQRHRIQLLEQALGEAKNEAASHRASADEAKAKTAGWEAFFKSLRGILSQYDIEVNAPKLKTPALPAPE